MTPEKKFIKSLESFFTSLEWTDFKRMRVEVLLNEYKKSFPKVRVIKEKTVINRVYLDRGRTGRNHATDSDLKKICQDVAKAYEITVEEMKSKKRNRHLVMARSDFYKAVMENTDTTYFRMGKFLNQHHTTVMHSVLNLKSKP